MNALKKTAAFALCAMTFPAWARGQQDVNANLQIKHDAEYYILYSQNQDRWNNQDTVNGETLAQLRDEQGQRPNIVHIMWDDTSFGDVGIPAINKIRGFETPALNRMAEEGMMFTRMYTEPSCTPTRAALLTGRHAIRSGMTSIGFPIEYSGISGDEVTIAEVLSEAGYATAFYGKLHNGDIEESWPHNQGFDETLFGVYNQITSLYNPMGEGANATIGMSPEILAPNPYQLDSTFTPKGWVMNVEAEKNGPVLEWRGTSHEDYLAFDPEIQERTIDFIRRNADEEKPFFVAYWPMLTSFIPAAPKRTQARGLYMEQMQYNVDAFIEVLMNELEALGIAENTIVIAMADNGPMAHNPPPGLGMAETIFRGGKGDVTEGGIRVPAFAWWPGTIEGGEISGDIIHITDLFTTFANLADAKSNIPTDRIVDGIDQTDLILNGDTHGRRDYVFVYGGSQLGAVIKGDYKFHVPRPGGDGLNAAFYFLPADPRESVPMMTNMLHHKEQFNRMITRHFLLKETFPDSPMAHGIPYTGIENARPETRALWVEPAALQYLPYDYEDVNGYDLPWTDPEVR